MRGSTLGAGIGWEGSEVRAGREKKITAEMVRLQKSSMSIEDYAWVIGLLTAVTIYLVYFKSIAIAEHLTPPTVKMLSVAAPQGQQMLQTLAIDVTGIPISIFQIRAHVYSVSVVNTETGQSFQPGYMDPTMTRRLYSLPATGVLYGTGKFQVHITTRAVQLPNGTKVMLYTQASTQTPAQSVSIPGYNGLSRSTQASTTGNPNDTLYNYVFSI
ncbi:uncharacterized protein BJ171DRAFT_68568 [Polychytrium aggregatum]|uniref:uncharacterized protein n=1 Tax=Polychytrium aggregatum TaxID=110093 RepID=UPI0022FEF330|nr:uncharacterized protein BJ171DRAFT_68568 [Polychytrium aggregatum]KAI9190688.1 hypothetical protein BJ171DRAFT_68568 [Polychytrium aggregatum]